MFWLILFFISNTKGTSSHPQELGNRSTPQDYNSKSIPPDRERPQNHDYGFYPPHQDYGSPRHNDSFRTPNKRDRQFMRRNNRDDATFGTPIDDDFINTEFDFEKNLALFDKQVNNSFFL